MRSLDAQHLEMFVAFECFAELPHGSRPRPIKIHLDKDRPFDAFGWLVGCITPHVSRNKRQTATTEDTAESGTGQDHGTLVGLVF